MTTYSDLIAPISATTIYNQIVAALSGAGLPTTVWDATSTPLRIAQAVSQAVANLAGVIPETAKGVVPGIAAGEWLDALGVGFFAKPRIEATRAIRNVTITDVGAIGPSTKSARTIWIVANDGRRYVNTVDFTIPLSSSVTTTFEAEFAGTSYNAAVSSWSYVTTIPGTTLANGGTPVATYAIDRETDSAYTYRLSTVWDTLSLSPGQDVLEAQAIAADSSVTRAWVQRNTPAAGSATVTIAGSTGTALSAGVVSTVLAYLQARAFNAYTIAVNAATSTTVTITGSVYVPSSALATATSGGLAALTAFEAGFALSGATVYLDSIKAQLLSSAPASAYTTLTLPSGNTVISAGSMPKFDTTGLSWVGF